MPKTPPLFVIGAPLVEGSRVRLGPDARRHAKARRLAEGSPVRLTDGAGGEADGVVERISRDACDVRVGGTLRRPPRVSGVEVLVSAIRLPRLSWLAEKATELGAERVTIVAAERSQRGRVEEAARQRERLVRIARAAAEQSGQPAPPEFGGPVSPGEARARAGTAGSALLLDASGEPFPASLRAPVALWVGPEGGWSAAELAAADAAGWRRVRLPGAVLRAETAAIAAIVLTLRAIDTAPQPGGQ